MRFEQRGPRGYSLMGVRAGAAWSYDAESDARQRAPASVAAFLQSHELHLIALAPEDRFGPPLRADTATFQGQPAFAVTFADALEAPLEVYYHRTLALPLGLRIRNPLQSDESRIDIVLEEWRPLDGLLLFTRVRFLQGDDVFQYHYADLKLNTLSASDFQATDDRLIDPDVAALLQLHQQHREDHLTDNADRFVSTFHEPFLSIDSGRVEVSSRDEARKRFQSYFDSVEFQAWDDITPPIVEISLDGTLATVTVHKRVQLTYETEEGEMASDHTVFAWVETWQKLNDVWKIVSVASTDRPGDR